MNISKLSTAPELRCLGFTSLITAVLLTLLLFVGVRAWWKKTGVAEGRARLIRSSICAGGPSIRAEDGASYSPEVCRVVSAVVNYKDLQVMKVRQDFSMSSPNL